MRDLLDLAVATAKAAGAMLLAERPPDLGVAATKSSPTDVVTEMDRAAERLIIDRIRAARPGDAFLGEETGASGGTAPVRWVIDPIDGTVNYLYGLRDWSVSIAAEVDGQAVAGTVAVPDRDELYTALRGDGAYVFRGDGAPERLACNAGVRLERALVATGFEYRSEMRALQAEVLTGVLPKIRDIRRAGSAAADLCAVASGRVDAYYERGPREWDIAAGSLIVTEAGGTVGGLNGAVTSGKVVIAAGRDLFAPLRDLLAPLRPDRD